MITKLRNNFTNKTGLWPLVGGLGLLLTLLSWSVATPVGGSPDEDFHLASIWCVSGGHNGMCEPTQNPDKRFISTSLLDAGCYAQYPESSAACQSDNEIFSKPKLIESDRWNFQGAYPDFFYKTMHIFSGSDVQLSVISMRIFNAFIFMAILSAFWLTLPAYMRASLYFTIALTVVPLGLFLIPSVNPSSWAIIGAITTFFGASGALRKQGHLRYLLWGLAAVGLLLAAGSRYDGLIYSLIALVAAFFMAKTFRIPKKVIIVSTVVIIVLSIAFILIGGIDVLQRLIGGAGASGKNVEYGPIGILLKNLTMLPMLFAGFSGAMGLGWLDTLMPFSTWMIASVLLWAALFSRVANTKTRLLWVPLIVAFLLVLAPLIVLQSGMGIVGENVQSRYIYPLMLVLAATMFFRSDSNETLFSTVQIAIISLGLFGSHGLALYTNMNRYISGVGSSQSSMNLNVAALEGWWWPVGPQPMTVLLVGTFGFGLFLVTAFIFRPKLSIKTESIQISSVTSK